TQGSADAGDLVRRDRRARPGPAADDRLLGPAVDDVAGRRLGAPGPVVALVVGQRAVREGLVPAPAQRLHDGIGDAGALVGRDGDPHALEYPASSAIVAAWSTRPQSPTSWPSAGTSPRPCP